MRLMDEENMMSGAQWDLKSRSEWMTYDIYGTMIIIRESAHIIPYTGGFFFAVNLPLVVTSDDLRCLTYWSPAPRTELRELGDVGR